MSPLLTLNNLLPNLSTPLVYFEHLTAMSELDCTKANKTYFLWVTHHGTQKIMPKYQYDIIYTFNCHVGIDCTKAMDCTEANKTYFLWEIHQ